MKVCQICQKHPATTHIKRSVNGNVSEVYVCSLCASQNGWGMLGAESSIDGVLGGFLVQPLFRSVDHAVVCKTCGSSYSDILRRSRVVCPDCYTTFYEYLCPSVQRLHGNSVHVGKASLKNADTSTERDVLAELKLEMEQAIAAQEFERCAQIRDKIREWEAKNHD